MADCVITPVSAFQSTNLNSKIDGFGALADRIVRSLGAPIITIEVHQDNLFQNIALACEMFSKFAGYTQEYLIFDSKLYERSKGIRLDHLYTLANNSLSLEDKLVHKTTAVDTAPYLQQKDTMYIATSTIPASMFSGVVSLSAAMKEGIDKNQILDLLTYNLLVSSYPSIDLPSCFTESYKPTFTVGGVVTNTPTKIYNNMFDYDLMDYRKVIAVIDFVEGSSNGINTLFTIEQTLAQQTYFSYAMGNYGFDLISWYVMKDWLENREKLLCTKQSYEFNDRTQYMRLYPEPNITSSYYGVINCYVERPLRDLIKEAWVYQYALALTKITVGNVRGKYGNLTMFGGQIFTQDLMTQGMAEKEKLEEQLYNNAAGMGDSAPCLFLVG